MMCRKCLEYNHTMKLCTKNDTVCAKCVLKGHDFKDCQSEILKCYHCGNNHKTGDRKCAIQHEQEEIMAIRSKMQVTREQAKLIYRKQNPKFQKTCAEVTQLTISNGTTAAERQGGSQNLGGDMGGRGVEESSAAGGSNMYQQNGENSKTCTREVVCVSPTLGSMYTRTVDLKNMETT